MSDPTPITTIDDLRAYLYTAIQLEHATIPPYLTALYSIHPGTNIDAYNVIRVVVVEEMLHLTLAANILNAVGGNPNLLERGFVATYPTYLPNGEEDFKVSLERFSMSAVDTFLLIEEPPGPLISPEKGISFIKRKRSGQELLPTIKVEDEDEVHYHYDSIGEFYRAISKGLILLNHELGAEQLFTGEPCKQVTPEYYYSGGGDIIVVDDLKSALQAIDLISEQGEGHGGGIFDKEGELAHYYRFQQLKLGKYYHKGDCPDDPSGEKLKIDWDAVYPIQTNARISGYPANSELSTAAEQFNIFYRDFLGKIMKALNGQPELLLEAVGDMFQIKEKAYQLMRNQNPNIQDAVINAAPTFEIDRILPNTVVTEE